LDGWTSVALGDGIDAHAPSGRIQEAFMALQLLGHAPPEAAVFSFYELSTNVVTAYFSPAAAPLGRQFGAHACNPPIDREGFSLLVGDARSRSILFRS
jgi:hypothetical protein